MTLRALAVAIAVAAAVLVAPAGASAQTSVPLEMARDRAARISDLQYEVHFNIPARKSDKVTGDETISFLLSDPTRPLIIDFGSEPITVPVDSLKRGRNVIHRAFTSSDASLNRNDEYLYTLFVPARASLALPVFDQPDLKARWKLTLTLPEGWQAVANGAEVKRTGNDVEFAETKPLPTYLFGFAAGKWQIESATRPVGDRTMALRMFHRETDTAKVARNRDSIFDLVARSVAEMEKYTAIPYPFEKYDFVAVPSFQFGGMEHAGAVLYQASTLFLSESATQSEKLGRASLIAHETAHMWFGDLVTMRWFNDVWLKEVMANFMAAKIVEPSFPQINHELRFLLAHYPAAYEVDRTAGTHPIRQELANLNEAGQLYGAIIYQKAPIVMRQLERIVGPDAFQRGMRVYLQTYAYANASFDDMIAALDSLTPTDLRAWSHRWIEEAGRPTVTARTASNPAFIFADTIIYGRTTRPHPLAVVPNGDGREYGMIVLDAPSRRWLLAHLPTLKNPVLRGAVWLDLWDAMLAHQITSRELIQLAQRALPRETDEQLTSRVLSYMSEAYWRYSSANDRTQMAPAIEALVRKRIAEVPTSSLKAAYFNTLRSVTLTPAGVNRLGAIWAKTDSVPGLKLSEDDYTALASALAIRRVANADSILEAQAARITNPDRKARFAFVRPTLSADRAVRDAWFESLKQRENRSHEPWVIEGLSNLNHPLHADSARQYIRPALAMLEEVRATGDIFFPKRWTDATLSGHTSPEAKAIVREFLRVRPDYPVRLRQIILQSL